MRGTGLTMAAMVMGVLSGAVGLAQSKPQFTPLQVTRYDFAIGYNNVRANAPPAGCKCFNMDGGFFSGAVHINNWAAVGVEVTGGHSSDISPLGQGLTLTTFTVGPRATYEWKRLTPFGEALVGGAHGSDSYFPGTTSYSTSASSFAFSTGGGVDISLTSRFSVRALDMHYLRTSFPNGINNEQNHLMIGAGLVIKIKGPAGKPKVAPTPVVEPPAPPPPPPPSVAFTCGTNVANVPLGQMVVITGDARTEPANLGLTYAWSTDGGSIEGTGSKVSINTTGMAVGDYRVTGHASLASNPQTVAECVAVFRVVPVEPPPPAAGNTYVTVVDPAAKDQKQFHENVKDAYFDVGSSKIKPQTLSSIIHAAQYLVAHPTIEVIISGWTDPRGSAQYNLTLGIKRAEAVRAALVQAGVSPSQLEIISNGKSSQVCTTADQKCWQENRRVSFTMKP